MLATSSCMAVKDTLQIGMYSSFFIDWSHSVAHLVQATSEDEVALESLVEKAKRYERDEIVPNSWY
jgi:hypothetical protein